MAAADLIEPSARVRQSGAEGEDPGIFPDWSPDAGIFPDCSCGREGISSA